MSRNYGLSRNLDVAGRIVLSAAAKRGVISYGTAARLTQSWEKFCAFAVGEGVKKMETISRELVEKFGFREAEEVRQGTSSASSSQNSVSAVNTVLRLVPEKNWQSVSPRKDCGISARSNVRTVAPASEEAYQKTLEALSDRPREASLVRLCRELGLRSEEASLLHVKTALRHAAEKGEIIVTLGTKGGRARSVPITTERQVEALRAAREAVGKDICLIPKDKNYAQWREGAMRHARDCAKSCGATGLHDFRAAYACARYEALTGKAAPAVAGSRQVEKPVDKAARLTISHELGHGRIDVTVAYLGSSK